MDIKELIDRGETQSVEFKESLKLRDEIGETVSAFSNSDGGAVIVGVSNSSSELRKLAKESGEKVYWDERVCENAGLEDIDEESVRWFLKEARKERGLNLSEDTPIEEALMKLKLNGISRKMATIDLTQLVTKGLLIRVGEGKRDIRYILPNYAKITQKITQKEA